jgi:hypothetical protein
MKMVIMHIILKKLERWREKRSQGKKKGRVLSTS